MSVSVLIPAFRPTFLRQAIASVLTQGHEDLELVVSDDSGGEDVRAVVEQFRDPRIRYIATAGRTGAVANCRGLWPQARHDRVIYLLDDDLLLPHAVVELSAQLDAHPQAAFAFGPRHIVDARGAIIQDADTPVAQPTLVSPRSIVLSLLTRLSNPFGEFSNVMINRAVGLTVEDMLSYQGRDLHVVADVGFFLNAARRGPAAATHRPVGCFRKHGAQNSSPAFNRSFPIGICEWELFIRGEFATGRITAEEAAGSLARLRDAYARWGAQMPAIGLMQPGLEGLAEQVARGDREVLGPEFDARWDRLLAAVNAAAPT